MKPQPGAKVLAYLGTKHHLNTKSSPSDHLNSMPAGGISSTAKNTILQFPFNAALVNPAVGESWAMNFERSWEQSHKVCSPKIHRYSSHTAI